jgi:multidrug resistance efflux pump
VNGYVTNLLLRVGDCVREGISNISIVDTDSFWVDGYFEEPKLAQMCIGDRAGIKLMGYAAPNYRPREDDHPRRQRVQRGGRRSRSPQC